MNLREIPEKHRELVKDFLIGAQKEKIEELLSKNKKSAKKTDSDEQD